MRSIHTGSDAAVKEKAEKTNICVLHGVNGRTPEAPGEDRAVVLSVQTETKG